MNEFLFLYRNSERPDSPEQMQQQMERWVAWMKELAAKGHIRAQGQPLERTGTVVSGRQKTITDGPYAEKDLVSGYTVIAANDLDEAAELSRGCPIFEVGGSVEIRPVMRMSM